MSKSHFQQTFNVSFQARDGSYPYDFIRAFIEINRGQISSDMLGLLEEIERRLDLSVDDYELLLSLGFIPKAILCESWPNLIEALVHHGFDPMTSTISPEDLFLLLIKRWSPLDSESQEIVGGLVNAEANFPSRLYQRYQNCSKTQYRPNAQVFAALLDVCASRPETKHACASFVTAALRCSRYCLNSIEEEEFGLEWISHFKDEVLLAVGPHAFLSSSLHAAKTIEENGVFDERRVNVTVSMMNLGINSGASPHYDFDTEQLLIHGPSHPSIQEWLLQHGWQCPPASLLPTVLSISPLVRAELRYKNLNAPDVLETKVPHRMHHIWLTHRSSPREMLTSDIDNICTNKEKFAQDWDVRVFTNDPLLIPTSKSALTKCGVVLESIYDHRYSLRGFSKIESLIEQKRWGMASDFLRYSLVWHFGGVYADANFRLHRALDVETRKYHFFSAESHPSQRAWDNSFFGASPHHPILDYALERTEFGLRYPPKIITGMQNQRSDVITHILTARPMEDGYYHSAHINGTKDVVYPYSCQGFGCFSEIDDGRFIRDISLVSCPELKLELEIARSRWPEVNAVCGIPEQHLLGQDGHDSRGTWEEDDS